MPLAVVLILLVVGSLLFHVLSPWTFTELASNWGMVDFTVDITLYVTGFVFVAVNLFMAYNAVGGFHGTVVDTSYVASQKYNGWLAKAETSRALGWQVVPTCWNWTCSSRLTSR